MIADFTYNTTLFTISCSYAVNISYHLYFLYHTCPQMSNPSRFREGRNKLKPKKSRFLKRLLRLGEQLKAAP